MKKIIAFMISTLLLMNLVFSTGVFAAGVLTIDKTDNTGSKLTYKVGDTIDIKGTCTPGKDVVMRVYDKNGAMVFVETILASDTSSGTYSFNTTVIPETHTSSQVTWKVVLSSPGATNITENITIGDGTPVPDPNPIRGSSGGSVTPSVDWTDSKEKIADKIENVKTEKEAEKAIDDITKETKEEEKKSEETRQTIAETTETMAANISAKTVKSSSNKLRVDKSVINASDLAKVDKTMAALQSALTKNKLELNRQLFKELVLKVKFDNKKEASIVITHEIIDLLKQIDILTISSDNYKVSYRVTELIELLGDQESVEIKLNKPVATTDKNDKSITKLGVTFDTDKTKTVKVSFAGIKGDTTYMAVVDENGNPVGGKYNPLTGCIEAKISESGVYSVVYNEKDFTDIKGKSADMQKAIKKLASVGVIEGTSATEFAPDDAISRAELAALVLRVIEKLDPNADGKFVDVKKTHWYFGTAGSAKKEGIVNGFEDNTFRADLVITRDQILAISARVLKNEMRYITPENPDEYLKYADSASIPDWAKSDIALATMADLVVKSTDNKFNSSSDMTRGDAAIIIMRLFEKLW